MSPDRYSGVEHSSVETHLTRVPARSWPRFTPHLAGIEAHSADQSPAEHGRRQLGRYERRPQLESQNEDVSILQTSVPDRVHAIRASDPRLRRRAQAAVAGRRRLLHGHQSTPVSRVWRLFPLGVVSDQTSSVDSSRPIRRAGRSSAETGRVGRQSASQSAVVYSRTVAPFRADPAARVRSL